MSRPGYHPVYNAWRNMRQRCLNPRFHQYHDYGGRGITICPEWESPAQFLRDMEPTWQQGLTLERRNNNEGYSKDNCYWATRGQQQRNKRDSHLTFEQAKEAKALWLEGKLSQGQIADKFGVPRYVISDIATRSALDV